MMGAKLINGNLTYIIIDRQMKTYYITQNLENAEKISEVCQVNTISLNADSAQELIKLIDKSIKAKENIYITATNNDPVGEKIRENLSECFKKHDILSMDCSILRTDRTVRDFKEFWEKYYLQKG